MSDVTPRQVRRLCAALTALWLVACGVLSLRHQAETGHVRDQRTGALLHAPTTIGDHHGGSDIHGCSDQRDDHGVCGLGVLDAPTVASTVQLAAHDVWRAAEVVADPDSATLVPRQVFRLAPKTSPPAG